MTGFGPACPQSRRFQTRRHNMRGPRPPISRPQSRAPDSAVPRAPKQPFQSLPAPSRPCFDQIWEILPSRREPAARVHPTCTPGGERGMCRQARTTHQAQRTRQASRFVLQTTGPAEFIFLRCQSGSVTPGCSPALRGSGLWPGLGHGTGVVWGQGLFHHLPAADCGQLG